MSAAKRRRFSRIYSDKSAWRPYLSLPSLAYTLPRSRGRAGPVGPRERRFSARRAFETFGWGPLAAGFAHRHGDLLELAGAHDPDRLGSADPDLPKLRIQVFQALGCGSVEGDQGVTLHQAGLVRRALRLDRHDQQAAVLVDSTFHGVGQWHFLGADPQVRPLDATLGPQAGHDALGDVHRNRPPVSATEDPTVHADHATFDIDQGPATETGLERCVGLDQVLDFAAAPPAPGGRDGADRAKGRLETARPADRQHDLPRPELFHLR